MNSLSWVAIILLGLLGGIFAGLFGIGGGMIIVPLLVLLGGMDQKVAQGTTLWMMLPPVGFFAAWEYWKHGDVNLMTALGLCVGFFAGGYLGARWGLALTSLTLQRIFGLLMIGVGIRMLIK